MQTEKTGVLWFTKIDTTDIKSDSDLKMGDYGESFQIYVPIVDEGKGCKISENIFYVPMLNLQQG